MNLIIIQNHLHQPGYYLSTVSDVTVGRQVKTSVGSCGTIDVTFKLHNLDELHELKQQNFHAFSSNKKLLQLFSAVLGKCPKVMDTDLLLGRECVVKIEHNTSNKTNMTFANVTQVLATDAVESDALANKEDQEVSTISEEAENVFNDD